MDKYLIRSYKAKDYKQIISTWEKTGVGSAKRGDNAEIIEQSLQIGGELLVLEINEKIIGTSWMTFDGRRIHLHHIAVLPEYQNKGYGKLLTEKSIDFAKQKGYQIKLEVHKNNKKAIRIYKNLGFKYLGDYDVYIIRDY